MDPRLTGLELQTLLHTLADFFLPRVCVVCGRQLLPQEKHLCCACSADLPLTHFEGLVHNPMADTFNSLVTAPRYERAAALFYYREEYRKITQALKYGRNFGAGREFARMLGERLASGGLWDDVDLVCCVPLHWTRRFRRGYNQAEIIAREVAAALRHSRRDRESQTDRLSRLDRESPAPVRFEPHLLRRVRRTGTQTRLSAEERSRNIAGAFRVNHAVLAAQWRRPEKSGDTCSTAEHTSAISGAGPSTIFGPAPQHILLIDDVFTTGATLAACYTALREALGPEVHISVATLAFVD